MNEATISQQEIDTLLKESAKNKPAQKAPAYKKGSFMDRYLNKNEIENELKALGITVRQEEVDKLLKPQN